MVDFPIPDQPQRPTVPPAGRPELPVTRGQNAALSMIRSKLDALYKNEPSAKEEIAEAEEITPKQRSKHQDFILSLTNSGKSLAQIQEEWHKYYMSLPDSEKHEVWNEFYEVHQRSSEYLRAYQRAQQTVEQARHEQSATEPVHHSSHHAHRASAIVGSVDHTDGQLHRSVADIKKSIVSAVNADGKLKAKHHLKSLAFGLSMGGLVVLVLMFGFFNERFIAPFITPSKTSALPVIIDASQDNNVGPEPLVYVPSINASVPVNYSIPNNVEATIQTALEDGVVKMAGTADPGQKGNVVVVGHSSNNILNKGKYKFAFVNLRKVNVGELFYLHKDGHRYTYKIIDKKIVDPSDVGITAQDQSKSIATLVTCDPPGTSLKRLILVGEQIRPDPVSNTQNTQPNVEQPKELPGNSPSLWSRIF